MSEDNRRGKVTDEHRREARLLKALWLKKKPELDKLGWGTQEAFGDKFGVGNQAAVGFFLNGHTALSRKAALAFAKGLGCEVSEFSPRLAKELPETPWPFQYISPQDWRAMGEKWQGAIEEAAVTKWHELQQRAQPLVAPQKRRASGP